MKRVTARMPETESHTIPTYKRIYRFVCLVPAGSVVTYGQIAAAVGGCTARMVGYALAALASDTDVPWHRVVNRFGKISPRDGDKSGTRQRLLLEAEGIRFDRQGQINLRQRRWSR